MQKFIYRLLVINTELKTKGQARDYDDILPDKYVSNHLYNMVAANLEAKRRLSQPRSWRLPLCIPYSDIKLEMDTISDGSWGVLGAGACLFYLVQPYQWQNEDRVSIYLYGGQVGLNPMLKSHH